MPLSRRRQQFNLSLWHGKAMRLLQGLVLVVLLSISGLSPAQALPGWPFNNQNRESSTTQSLLVPAPTGTLQEIAPPGAVQQIREQLAKHHPQLSLESPTDGTVLTNEGSWELLLNLKDWPLTNDPELGLGAHVVVQLDENPPLRISEADGAQLRIAMEGLQPGSHRLSAYAAYPWGEAVKDPKASLQWRLHQLQSLQRTQPTEDEPWFVTVSPSELSNTEPLLLDWLIWNAPIQNLKEGDGRWRLQVSVNGESFQITHQDAIWIKGLPSGSGPISVQTEMLDGFGKPINPVFNNQLRIVQTREADKPAWMQATLTKQQIARLLGEPQPEEDQPLADQTPQDKTELPKISTLDNTSESKPIQDELSDPSAKQELTLSSQPEPELEIATELEPESDLEPTLDLEPNPDPESALEPTLDLEPNPDPESALEPTLDLEPNPDPESALEPTPDLEPNAELEPKLKADTAQASPGANS
ncbi:hypothetical protein [Prochlorococcus sp. MIT 1306]|uniref:hypothetical protein n=1 Tax=Prochlorococcus sp. MIT 1306 TaxID=1799667 RepID=UPI001E4C8226|nr:hypothetical protein [Prochlorococcus sp. MIT 1306]